MQTSITLSTTFPARQSHIQPATLPHRRFSALNITYWHLLTFAVTDLGHSFESFLLQDDEKKVEMKLDTRKLS
jgi:hypothetical protein